MADDTDPINTVDSFKVQVLGVISARRRRPGQSHGHSVCLWSQSLLEICICVPLVLI